MVDNFNSLYRDFWKINAILLKLNLLIENNISIKTEGDGVSFIHHEKYTNPDLDISNKYEEEYYDMLSRGVYTFLMVDYTMLQYFNIYSRDTLVKQNIGYVQSPYDVPYDLVEVEEEEEENEKVLTKICDLGSYTRMRFEYDPDNFENIKHPRTHLHLGCYKDCRIPINKPMRMYDYIKFVIKNFYSKKYDDFIRTISSEHYVFNENAYADTITSDEIQEIHISV